MIRLIFRLLALAALSVAAIMAVLDATRSIAQSALVLTPLADSWAFASPATLTALRDWVVVNLHPLVWDPLAASLLGLPGFVIFAALAFLLHAIGHRPESHRDRLAL
jgi:hypothetical protein